jgi:PadR family transcriptional regulator PadR
MAIVRGTLDILVLKALSWTPMHAYEISRWLDERSGSELSIEDAALMQAIRRLENRALIDATWGITVNNRRARYYELTTAGRRYLREEGRRLSKYANALASVLALRSSRG